MQPTHGARFSCYALLILMIAMPQWHLWAVDKAIVFVSVLPQKLFVERIGGDQVDVRVMVKPGFSPATYEPTPRQISALGKASLYFRIGVPFEQAWMPRIQSVNPSMKLVDARKGLVLRQLENHHHHHEDDAGHEVADEHAGEEKTGELDSHLWTSPRMAIQMAEQIREQLTALQPENSAQFTENYDVLVAELEALDEELAAMFDGVAKKFMVFHPSWGYFADAYGLTQLAIEAEGKEPGARALAQLIKQARQNDVKTIFVQPQFDERAAKQVAKAIDGKVVAINPLAADYFANMRRVGRLIAGIGDE